MEDSQMFSGEFEGKINGKGEVEKYLTVYPLAECKNWLSAIY
jgi:hypothetical protein